MPDTEPHTEDFPPVPDPRMQPSGPPRVRVSDAEHARAIAEELGVEVEPEPELDRDPFVEQAMDEITQAERDRLVTILETHPNRFTDVDGVAHWIRAGGTVEGL